MNLTKNEIIKYLILIVLFGVLGYLFDFIAFLMNFSIQFEEMSRSMAKYDKVIYWICFISSNALTAFFIHVSEKRIGNKTNIIWQMTGFILGFIGFLAYGVWCIMIKNDLFIKDETQKAL